MANAIADELRLSRAWFFGIFSGALLLSGLFGPLAGRMIDGGGRPITSPADRRRAVGHVTDVRPEHVQQALEAAEAAVPGRRLTQARQLNGRH